MISIENEPMGQKEATKGGMRGLGAHMAGAPRAYRHPLAPYQVPYVTCSLSGGNSITIFQRFFPSPRRGGNLVLSQEGYSRPDQPPPL